MTRFMNSAFIQDSWPEEIRASALDFFKFQISANQPMFRFSKNKLKHMARMDLLIRETSFHTLVLWHLGTSDDHVRIAEKVLAEGNATKLTHHVLGLNALAERDFEAASEHFELALGSYPGKPNSVSYQVYSLCMADRCDLAKQLVKSFAHDSKQSPFATPYWRWIAKLFDL